MTKQEAKIRNLKRLLNAISAKSERRRKRLTKCYQNLEQIFTLSEDRVIRELCVEALQAIEGAPIV